MAERKRFSQELMQGRNTAAKRDMEFLFDNQPYDPRDTFKGELARRAMMYGEIPFGRGMRSDMYGISWFKKQQGNALDIAIERQTLNDELIPNIPLDVFGKKKELKQYEARKNPQMKYFIMQNKQNENTKSSASPTKKRRTADQEISTQNIVVEGKRLKNDKSEEVNQSKPLAKPDELNQSEQPKQRGELKTEKNRKKNKNKSYFNFL